MFNKKVKKPHLVLILIIVAVFSISLYWWKAAANWHDVIVSGDSWYAYPELSRMEIRDTYNLAFNKIILLHTFVFLSSYLFFQYKKYIKNL